MKPHPVPDSTPYFLLASEGEGKIETMESHHSDHQQQQDGGHAHGHGNHLHHQSVAPVELHGVDGHAIAWLVLGGAEKGSVLRHTGVGDKELTPGTQAALKYFG